MQHRRHWRARGVVALAAALAVVASLATAPATASPEPSTMENQIFNAGFLNIKRDLTNAKFRHDLSLVASKAALVGLNETAGRWNPLQFWLGNHPKWSLHFPSSTWARDNAMLYKNTMFEVVSRGSRFNCDSNGDELPHPRHTNWVRYRHKGTGRNVFHINTHANPHIDNNGHPYDNNRIACAEEHFKEIRALAREKKDTGQVIVTGDLNVDFVADKRVQYGKFPYAVFDAQSLPSLRSSYTIYGAKGDGTHGDRHIDYIYFWKRVESARVMWMQNYHIFGDTYSDHDGLVANFEIAS